MPEGPEIRRAADEIGAALARRVAKRVFFAAGGLKPFEDRLSGRRVRRVEARGKAILVRFAGGLNVFSHNQLYGRWIVRDDHDEPETTRSLRFAVYTRAAAARLYSASTIEVLRDDALGDHPYLSKLGPDVLDRRFTRRGVERRLADARFRRRSLGSLLLDQSFLSGLGNYLRSEILFVAGVDPRRRPDDLAPDERRALARGCLALPRRSLRTGGITNEPGLVRSLRRRGWTRARYRFQVFGRESESCHDCGTEIERLEVAGRRLYLCSACQA